MVSRTADPFLQEVFESEAPACRGFVVSGVSLRLRFDSAL